MSDAGDFDQYMDGDNIVSNVDTDIYACTFEKTVNGYSIHCADGYIGYTSTATSKNNNLWFSPNIVEKQYEWTISYSKCVEIQNVYNTKTHYLGECFCKSICRIYIETTGGNPL